ncbi:MAG: type III-A CRISPR-associated protein Csm2 [Nitrospirota bacterium]
MSINFWKDNKQKKIVDPELFSTIAERFAKEIHEEKKKKDKVNNPTQIRKFYDEVVHFDTRNRSNEDFKANIPYIKMLYAKAVYAEARDLVSPGFKRFIKNSIEQINEPEDIEVFARFFEAFMGFYRFEIEQYKRQKGGRGL